MLLYSQSATNAKHNTEINKRVPNHIKKYVKIQKILYTLM